MKRLGLLLAAAPTLAYGHVRQRIYIPISAAGASGTESIIHWDPADSVKISMHSFTGTLGNSSALNLTTAKAEVTSALGEWSGDLFPSVPSGLTFDLSGGAPYASSSSCETDTGSGRSVVNNIVFTTKLAQNCSDNEPLGASSGVIGLTRVLYQSKTGLIVEADIQFNDLGFKFQNTAGNNLTASPKQIYLKDVVTHELGHFFGLDHSSVRDSTMLFAVSDGLESPEPDDKLGLISLYPSTASSTNLGQVQGSVTSSTGSPIFGAVVFAHDARTLRPVATELTNANGAFQFCALPAGNYFFVANRYRPLSTNIHSYYSGDGAGNASDEAGCFNPSCGLMTSAIRTTLVDQAPTTGAGGRAMKTFNVAAGAASGHLNIVADTAEPTLDEVSGTGTGSALTIDEPRFAKLGTSSLEVGGGPVSAVHRYNFTATATTMHIRTAALRLYGRLELALSLRDADTPGVDATTALCGVAGTPDPTNPEAEDTISVAYGVDPWMSCTSLVVGESYVLQVSATAAACDEIPGNGATCDDDGNEPSSTAQPYYVVTVYDPATSHSAGGTTEASSLAATTFNNLPSCSDYSAEVTKGSASSEEDDTTGGCCGTIKSLSSGGPPDGPKTLLLTLALSPVLWFAIAWAFWPRKRSFQITGLRAQRSIWGSLWAAVLRKPKIGAQLRLKMVPSAKREM